MSQNIVLDFSPQNDKTGFMVAKTRTLRGRQSNSPRAIRDQRSRRKMNLFLKAFEYCQQCDADVFMMVRLKHNGQSFIFNSDGRGPPSHNDLVINIFKSHVIQTDRLQDLQYPTPRWIGWQELAARYKN